MLLHCIANIPFLPLALITAALVACAALLQKQIGAIKAPDVPWRPYNQGPGLAMELANTKAFVDRVLDTSESEKGKDNRKAVRVLQYLDFVFIPLYTALFITVAVLRAGWSHSWIVVDLAILTALFDIIEDVHILRLIGPNPARSVRPFGRLKWLFYFATLAAEGSLLLHRPDSFRPFAGLALGILLILNGGGGILSSLKLSFTGIASAAKLSLLGLLGLALAPYAALVPAPWREVAEYAILLRVPLLLALLLVVLPVIAFTAAKSLLQGLFDLTPLSLFTVALTAFTVAGTCCMTAYLVLAHAPERFAGLQCIPGLPLPLCAWLVIMAGLSAPVTGTALVFSVKQTGRSLTYIAAALAGTALALTLASAIILNRTGLENYILLCLRSYGVEACLQHFGVFQGYVTSPNGTGDPLLDHVRAFLGFGAALILYLAVGLCGWFCLGKRGGTVPALSSALMLMMILGWMLSATTFFFDAWHIPTLLIVAAAGTLTTFSTRSDHYYDLRDPAPDRAPTPVEAVAKMKPGHLIVAAANGGGIQAGAWAAQVLFGLCDPKIDPENKFRPSLRLISSVSGGSLGSACFMHWLANPDDAKTPDVAASSSSLDEVAWGLGWTELLRALLPWFFSGLIGRGRALERAWCRNSSRTPKGCQQMDLPLSNWNARVTSGELPAVVMNATITETGERLLLATTALQDEEGRARVNGSTLHTFQDENGVPIPKDVGVVTAARLSASFPYVTPAARCKVPGAQPHVVDGGYYDNYGMATLVEWLDEALQGANGKFPKVLVLQIHGAKVPLEVKNERYKANHGWFYQAIAPLITLNKVRGAGQIAHKEIELEFLQQKWKAQNVHIEDVLFEFPDLDTPLSWHLTSDQIKKIRYAWDNGPAVSKAKRQVQEFLT